MGSKDDAGKDDADRRLLDEDARREELLRAPKADEEDAAPRIVLSEGETGATRIHIADTAVVRPGRIDREP